MKPHEGGEDINRTDGLVDEVSEPSTQSPELPSHSVCSEKERSVSACLTKNRPKKRPSVPLGVDGKDVRSGVVEKKLDVSLAKDEGEGTRQPSSGKRRPKRSFTHSMDRRMSHTLPAFQLDDVLKRLRMGNFDRISSDAGGRNYQTIYRTLTAEKTAGERRRRVERQGKNNRGR
jgi:hypothetical protein